MPRTTRLLLALALVTIALLSAIRGSGAAPAVEEPLVSGQAFDLNASDWFVEMGMGMDHAARAVDRETAHRWGWSSPSRSASSRVRPPSRPAGTVGRQVQAVSTTGC